ncbi:MAG: S9 family peptidase [Acidobacteria bacterium]|nr:S9 family peptidase [Acidobacteriota bacterium]MBI3421505.1 S9 family peptidase [Acidobacteriota bacterium]
MYLLAGILFCTGALTATPLQRSVAAQQRRVPTVDDLINVKAAGGAQISPDGKWVAYTVNETDWKQDAFVTHVWLVNTTGGKPFQLTRGEKGCGNPQWSPDGAWLAFTSNRVGDKNQLFVIRPDGGEATQLTKAENGVNGYAWSRDGKSIAYTASDADSKAAKERQEYLGGFEVVRKEYAFAQLWTLEVAAALNAPVTGTQRTKNKDYTIGGFEWSPDGSRIAFSATVNADLINGGTADVYVLTLADNAAKKIVALAGPDNSPHWSPDGKQLVFSSAMGNPKFFHANSRLALVFADGGTPRSLTDAFDEQPGFVEWNGDGIYFSGAQKTASHLFRLDPASGKFTRLSAPDNLMANGFSFTTDGKQFAFTSPAPASLSEVFLSSTASFTPRKLTSMTEQVANYTLASREVISWPSKDGATIEGILIKPADFDPNKKYPLLCVIHGGPTGVDRRTLLDARYYPADIWAAKGALVLKVNYRGSAGYGEKFRLLNVRNLGVGDAWDVLSGVDYLIGKGWVDGNRVGCMGWSQGGYISAFLTTSSDRFKAISVGAGISNWATYYYNTDITPFTIQYLGHDPADDPAIYAKTSPMTYIKQAKTPTLIQHGEFDKRVPIPNAYELRQGLEDRGVPVEMVVYKGYGHGITKPKSMRAVMQHNLGWFNHYIFGEPLPDFSKPELPSKADEKKMAGN